MVGMALFVVGGELHGLVGGWEDGGGREKVGVWWWWGGFLSQLGRNARVGLLGRECVLMIGSLFSSVLTVGLLVRSWSPNPGFPPPNPN